MFEHVYYDQENNRFTIIRTSIDHETEFLKKAGKILNYVYFGVIMKQTYHFTKSQIIKAIATEPLRVAPGEFFSSCQVCAVGSVIRQCLGERNNYSLTVDLTKYSASYLNYIDNELVAGNYLGALSVHFEQGDYLVDGPLREEEDDHRLSAILFVEAFFPEKFSVEVEQ